MICILPASPMCLVHNHNCVSAEVDDNLYSLNCSVFHWGLFPFRMYKGMPQNIEIFFLLFFSIASIIKQHCILAELYAYYNSNCFHKIIFRLFPYVLRYLSCMQNYLFCKNTNSRVTTVFMITNLIESKAP